MTLAALVIVLGPHIEGEPGWPRPAAAVLVTVGYAAALAARTGGQVRLTAALALALALAGVLAAVPVLTAAAAVSTAALGAVLGVLLTVPAARFVTAVRECVIGTVVTLGAACGALGYDASLSLLRTGYVVLGLSLLATLVLCYRLAAGLHGLGTRGLVVVVSAIVLLAVVLAYTEALSRWGSPQLVDDLQRTTTSLRSRLGGLPRPVEFLVGFPALAWGVTTRARRRQGWWGVAFGSTGLAVVAVTLMHPGVSAHEALLGTAYSLLLGVLIGYLVVRADRFLSGERGRRARRREEAEAHRPEPGRFEPLL